MREKQSTKSKSICNSHSLRPDRLPKVPVQFVAGSGGSDWASGTTKNYHGLTNRGHIVQTRLPTSPLPTFPRWSFHLHALASVTSNSLTLHSTDSWNITRVSLEFFFFTYPSQPFRVRSAHNFAGAFLDHSQPQSWVSFTPHLARDGQVGRRR